MANESGKKKVVLASGVFDLLHLGHVKFLEEAKRAGGPDAQLVVIIARDSTVEKTKGRKPIMLEEQRRSLVESLRVVDKAVLGYENFDIGEVIENSKPDVIALGYDQEDMMKQVQDYVKKNKLNVKVVRIGKFGEKPLDSSSRIKQEIIDKRDRLSYAESKFGHSDEL
ncbi:MAG TPA: adenylyltransferase/cytidyltransferase family protein [Candidatus Limnocylindrales bacterium]|nr:adenylyltransferase/cytidyltransferase family protein [Candidatus Limnocylindrales bacterium]